MVCFCGDIIVYDDKRVSKTVNVNINENPSMEALGEGTRMSYDI